MSYTLQTTTLCRSNTNAEFQAWGKQISDAIANCGIVRESDANVGTQINWATVAAPNTGSQSRGYEIYRFDDAMQATTPVYFKIEYGSGVSATQPSLWLTVGSGANASGNVTGNVATRQSIIATSVQSTNVASYYAGANNRLIFVFCAGGIVQSQIMLGLERTLDSTGNVTSDGLAIIASGSTVKSQVLWTPATGNVSAYETTFGVLTPGSSQNSGLWKGVSGELISWYPLFVNQGAKWFPPQTLVVAYFNGEIQTGTVCQFIPVYSVNTPYMAMGNTCMYNVAYRGGNRTTFAIRWE